MSAHPVLRTLSDAERAWAAADAWSLPIATVCSDVDLVELARLVEVEQLAGFSPDVAATRVPAGLLDHAVSVVLDPDPFPSSPAERWEYHGERICELLCEYLISYREEGTRVSVRAQSQERSGRSRRWSYVIEEERHLGLVALGERERSPAIDLYVSPYRYASEASALAAGWRDADSSIAAARELFGDPTPGRVER